MTMGRRPLLALAAFAPLILSACATTGGSEPPFESNVSFRLMLYG